jgi:hypothetical protein
MITYIIIGGIIFAAIVIAEVEYRNRKHQKGERS